MRSELIVIFPMNKVEQLWGLCFCINCGFLFLQNQATKDHGICSLDCGYEYRGIGWSDFI